MGYRAYEDDAQQLDPHFHIFGEVERPHMEKLRVKDFRSGTEIKFESDIKRPKYRRTNI